MSAAALTGPDLTDDVSADPVSTARRDAVVRLSSGCGGILITPRIVATAAHCVPVNAVIFGPVPTASTALRAGVVGCTAHPGVFAHLGVEDPPCTLVDDPLPPEVVDWVGAPDWTHQVSSLDWALLVLDRRVDGIGTAIVAAPAGVLAEAPPPTSIFRAVSREHTDPTQRRVVALLTNWRAAFLSGHPELGAYSAFDRVGDVEFARGDSGSPAYLGDPDEPAPLMLATVFSGAGYSRAAWDPEVADWLAPFLEPEARFAGVYVGPADHTDGLPHDDDLDADGLSDAAHDNCPAREGRGTYNPDQIDGDGDGIGDVCDACPTRFDAGVDSDADGIPDGCDLCPSVPRVGAVLPQPDEDGDRIGDECDNCVHLANRLQENCNIDAELEVRRQDEAAGRPLTPHRGDVCDVTPCGETLPSASTPTYRFGGTRVRVGSEALLVDARRADVARGGGTGLRVCPCPTAERDDLRSRLECTRACPISDVNEYDRSQTPGEREGTAWRWISTRRSVAEALSTTRITSLPYGRSVDGRFVSDASFDHGLHAVDVPRWLANPDLRVLYPLDAVEARSVRAVVWTHTSTFASPLPGRPAEPLSRAIRLLSSHYLSGAAPESVDFRVPPGCLAPVGPLPGDTGCPYCGGFFPELYFGRIGARPSGACREDVSDRFGIDVGAAWLDRDAITTLPMPDPSKALRSDLRWVTTAEPSHALPGAGLRYVGLTADNAVRGIVLSDEKGYFVFDPAQVKCSQDCFAASAGVAAAPSGEPPPLDGAAVVFSGARGMLFVVGGTLAGAHIDAVHAYSAQTFRWRALPGGMDVPLGRVLAATYSVGDDRLLVLDEEADGHGAREVRVVAISPDSGDREVRASFRRRARADRFSLAADATGTLFVAASTGVGAHGAHVVLELGEDGERMASGPGTLVDAPIHASLRGISVPVATHDGTEVRGYAWTDFVPGRGLPARAF